MILNRLGFVSFSLSIQMGKNVNGLPPDSDEFQSCRRGLRGRRRYAYAAHHTPLLRHEDANVVETRWVEARWLQRLVHC